MFAAGARTRFAPSPTGDLHLGGAWTALASWVVARATNGRTVLRIEDLDPPRVVQGSVESIQDDLEWLGLDWDEGPRGFGPHGPYEQSRRTDVYEAALAKLSALGLVYPCDCSRAEIARVASAPHEGEDVRYPGTCRDRDPSRPMKRPPALRLRVPSTTIGVDDLVAGSFSQNLDEAVGDFVLRRGDGVVAYQLAVVVDDLAMEISPVFRGRDLLASTPRQIHLAKLLGAVPPAYGHLPLVVGEDGARLEKRTRGASVRMLRETGVASEAIIGALARGLGFTRDSSPNTPAGVVTEVGSLVGKRFPPQSDLTFRIPTGFAALP